MGYPQALFELPRVYEFSDEPAPTRHVLLQIFAYALSTTQRAVSQQKCCVSRKLRRNAIRHASAGAVYRMHA